MVEELKKILFPGLSLLLLVILLPLSLSSRIRSPKVELSALPRAGLAAGEQLDKKGRELFLKLMCDKCHSLDQKEYQSGGIPWMEGNVSLWVAYFYSPATIHPFSTKPNYKTLLRRDSRGRYHLTREAQLLIRYLRRARFQYTGLYKASAYKLQFSDSSLDGKQLYRKLCRSCHGDAGRGDGPLSKILPRPPRDLTKLKNWHCRSAPTAPTVSDLQEVLTRQLAGCGTPDIKEFLSPTQMKKLLKYVSTLAGIGDQSPAPAPPPPEITPKELDTPKFHHWKRALWQFEYRLALEILPPSLDRQLYPLADWRDWRERVKWLLFDRYLREKSIDLSPAGWEADLLNRPRFKRAAESWLQTPTPRPLFSEFLKEKLRESLRKLLEEEYRRIYPEGAQIPWWNIGGERRFREHWISTELKFRWKSFIRRQQFREYLTWRRVKEKELFKKWEEEFDRELYAAYRGEELFKEKGCSKCHNSYQRAELFVHPTCGTDRKQLFYKLKFAGGEKFDLYHKEILGPRSQLKDIELQYLAAYIKTLYLIKSLPFQWTKGARP